MKKTMERIICGKCGTLMTVPQNEQDDVTCSCGEELWVNEEELTKAFLENT